MRENLSNNISVSTNILPRRFGQQALDEIVAATNAVAGAVYCRSIVWPDEAQAGMVFARQVSQVHPGIAVAHRSKITLQFGDLADTILHERIPIWIDASEHSELKSQFDRCFFDRAEDYAVTVAIPVVQDRETQNIFVLSWNDHSFARTGIRMSLCRSLESYWKHLSMDGFFGLDTIRTSSIWGAIDNRMESESVNARVSPPLLEERSFGKPNERLRSQDHVCTRLRCALTDTIASGVADLPSHDSILRMLQNIAVAGGFHRAGVLQNVEENGQPGCGFWKLIHEWATESCDFQSDVLPGMLSWESFPEFHLAETRFRQGTPVDGVRSELTAIEQDFMESIGTHYTVNLPMFIGGQWWGVLAFDDCGTERRRTAEELSVLLAAARYLSGAIREQQDREHHRRVVHKLAIERELAVVSRLEAGERANAMIRRCASKLSDSHALNEVIVGIIASILQSLSPATDAFVLFNRPDDDSFIVSLYGVKPSIPCSAIHLLPNPLSQLRDMWSSADYEWMEVGPSTLRNLLGQHLADEILQGISSFARFSLPLGEGMVGYLLLFLERRSPPGEQEVAVTEALIHQLILALELERLAAQVRLAGRIEERNNLAREIHDTLAQSFLGISLQLGKLERHLQNQELIESELRLARELAKHGLQEARRSMQVLRGLSRPTRSFQSELKAVVDYFVKVSSTPIQLDLGADLPDMPLMVAETILRVTSEALGNAVRHSNASIICVKVIGHGGKLIARISDDGVGITEAKPNEFRYGILGMRERAELVGGALMVTSSAGCGTAIELVIPVKCRKGIKW